MFKLAEAFVEFSTKGAGVVSKDTDKIKSGLQGVKGSAAGATGGVKGFGGALGGITAASTAVTAGLAVLEKAWQAIQWAVNQATEAIKAFQVQSMAERRLSAVLRATGEAAGFSSDQLKEMAGDLQKVTNFGDEATIQAQALLATFTNIKGDIFKGAIRSAMDLSTIMETDLKGSVLQIGKALNDPIKGVSALADSGIQFTKDQTEGIKSLVEAGKTYEAQLIILNELQNQFGGVAQEAVSPWGQLLNIFGDFQEMGGEFLDEILQPMMGEIKGVAEELMEQFRKFLDSPETQEFIDLFGEFLAENIKTIGTLLVEFGKIAVVVMKETMKAINPLLRGINKAWELVNHFFGIETRVKEVADSFKLPDIDTSALTTPATTSPSSQPATNPRGKAPQGGFIGFAEFGRKLMQESVKGEDPVLKEQQKQTGLLAKIAGEDGPQTENTALNKSQAIMSALWGT